MIAARLAYLLFNDKKYLKIYNEINAYCEKYFVDKQNGEWYGYLHYDNTVANVAKGNIFKGPFHIPRFYMMMAVIDRDGSIDAYAE
jgi:N-acylglucosamine 2-epimerase